MLQTVLVLVLLPLALYVVIALLAAGRKRSRRTRYRPGDSWDHAPVWWSANPAGARQAVPAEHGEHAGGARGGADGGW